MVSYLHRNVVIMPLLEMDAGNACIECPSILVLTEMIWGGYITIRQALFVLVMHIFQLRTLTN